VRGQVGGARDSRRVVPDDVLARLTEEGLVPPPAAVRAEDVGLRGDGDVEVLDKAQGALLGGAIGDALGRAVEGRPRHVVRERYGVVRDFQRWRGWQGGPVGTITDDTQLTMVVAEALVAGRGRIDPDDLARRFVDWLPHGRGVGHATRSAVTRLQRGVPWHEAGEPSAGNGAAMRAGPLGIVHRHDLDALRRDAALSALVTHRHPMAVSSTIAQAFAAAWCLHRAPGAVAGAAAGADVAGALLPALATVLADVHDPGAPERRHGTGPERVCLRDRILEVGAMLHLDADDAFDRLWNGAFVLESLPAAMWCFLASPGDFEQVVVTAVNQGRDADTVAAMAGTLAGAYAGARALPDRFVAGLEYADDLRGLAGSLVALDPRSRVTRRSGGTGQPAPGNELAGPGT
jgi:ADP-ribosyl-[dinitrogen reductase] hydrolase